MSTITPQRRDLAPYLDDATKFAAELYSNLGADGEPRVLDPAGPAHEAYQVALQALEQRPPDAPVTTAQIVALDEAAGNWASASHEAGIRFGVAAEQLRQSLLAGASS